MSLFTVFDIAGSAMSAQSVRLNTVASNLANADSAASSVGSTYRARHPVFATMVDQFRGNQASAGVEVLGIVEDQKPLHKEYQPGHPMATADGYVFKPNVNTVEEMTNMMSASRAFRNNVQVMNTSRELLLNTLRLGQ